MLENGVIDLRCGESVVQSAELVVGSWVCVVGCGGCQSDSEGWGWFFGVVICECGGIGCRCGGCLVCFLYISCFVRMFSSANVVFAVGDAAKVWCKVPNWLGIWRFSTVVRAIANGFRRVWGGFQGFFICECGGIGW